MTTSAPMEVRKLDRAIPMGEVRRKALRHDCIVAFVTPFCMDCIQESKDDVRLGGNFTYGDDVARLFRKALEHVCELVLVDAAHIVSGTDERQDRHGRRHGLIRILSGTAAEALFDMMAEGKPMPVFVRYLT